MSFDVRGVFRSLSDSMCADFEKSAQIPHATGKGSIREDIVRRFLRDYLPSKYAVGEGQIIHSSNRISGQIDIVIYDQCNCPRLLVGEGHSIFPLESVYGIVSVKSVLTSSELSDAFDNVVSAKELTEERTIIISNRGMMLGLANPIPVGIIFAFDVNRSLEAVAKQAQELQARLTNQRRAPDLIVILGRGIVGPRERVRNELNQVSLPTEDNRMLVREVRHHTLLRFYLQFLDELNTITLAPLSLGDYLNMPELIDGHRVSQHGPHFLLPRNHDLPVSAPPLKKLGVAFIKRVIEETKGCSPIPYREHLKHTIGNVNVDRISPELLDSTVIEFNPQGRPSMMDAGLDLESGRTKVPAYSTLNITIDGQTYAIDFSAITPDDWEMLISNSTKSSIKDRFGRMRNANYNPGSPEVFEGNRCAACRSLSRERVFDRECARGTRLPSAVVAKKWAVARVLDDVERTRDHTLGIVAADFSPPLRDRSSVFFVEEFRSVGELQ